MRQADGKYQPICCVVCDVFQIYPVPLSDALLENSAVTGMVDLSTQLKELLV
jgi:hypothetical protein